MARGLSKKAKERKERRLLEEKINNSKMKCEEARGYLEPTGRHAEPNYIKTKEALDEAIQLYDAHALPYFLLGECCRAQGELRAAVEHYSKALDMDPRHSLALENRALCYQGLNDIRHALEDYSSMIQQEPDNDFAYNMRGMCLASIRVPGLRLRNADFKRCESDLKTAVRLNEANYYAMANLGKLYEDQGNLPNALKCYSSSLLIKHNYTYAQFRRGCAALQLAEKMLGHDVNGMTAADAEEEVSPTEAAGDVPAAKDLDAATKNKVDIEREVFLEAEEEKEMQKARDYLTAARDDFAALYAGVPDEEKNMMDVNVVLNLGLCAFLLGDLNQAEDNFNIAEKIIAARPSLVESEEAQPIENVEQIQRVLELRKAQLRQEKLKRAQTTAT